MCFWHNGTTAWELFLASQWHNTVAIVHVTDLCFIWCRLVQIQQRTELPTSFSGFPEGEVGSSTLAGVTSRSRASRGAAVCWAGSLSGNSGTSRFINSLERRDSESLEGKSRFQYNVVWVCGFGTLRLTGQRLRLGRTLCIESRCFAAPRCLFNTHTHTQH